MKPLLLAMLASLTALPAWSGQWGFAADLEGGANFWTFYNDTGTFIIDHASQNEIIITKLPDSQPMNKTGGCTFHNCMIAIYLDGRVPEGGEQIHIQFSNGFELNFKQLDKHDETLMTNFYEYSAGAANGFEQNIRKAKWVDIRFGESTQYRFDLTGSTAALDAILPYCVDEWVCQ